MRDFKKFNIWIEGMDIVSSVYTLCENFPAEERFGLKSQVCRAAVSIPSNIAEGCSRNSEVEFKRFLEIALGSSFELETQMILANRVGYLSDEQLELITTPLNQLQRKMNSLVSKIKDNSYTK